MYAIGARKPSGTVDGSGISPVHFLNNEAMIGEIFAATKITLEEICYGNPTASYGTSFGESYGILREILRDILWNIIRNSLTELLIRGRAAYYAGETNEPRARPDTAALAPLV